MSISLLPLCSTGKQAMRDGWAGATANIILPFYEYGFWFASGQQYTFPKSEIAQNTSRTLSGQAKPAVFSKTCCDCVL